MCRFFLTVFGFCVYVLVDHATTHMAHADPPSTSSEISATETTDDAATESEKRLRDQRLADMRERAMGTTTYFVGTDKKVELRGEPIFRYSDQPRDIEDGTLWALGASGRPSALLKIETYRRKTGVPSYLFSMSSLSQECIRTEWNDGHRWTSRKPGVDLNLIPSAPESASSQRGRMTQMKDLIRRFNITAEDPGRGKEVQRLLANPVYRYDDLDATILDGVIFAFTSNGTNPSALVVIELRQADAGKSAWYFAPARLTDAALEVSIDRTRVWTAEGSSVGPVSLETWLYFWESEKAEK